MTNTNDSLCPPQWQRRTLENVANVCGGGTPSTAVREYWGGDINWITPTEVGRTKYIDNSKRKLTRQGLSNSSATLLPIGTLLMTTRASIGELAILKVEAATNQGFQSLVVKPGTSVEFLYYLMQSKKGELIRNASGSTFLEISPARVKSLSVCIPPLEEQQAIAEVLSDVDELIAQTERLIAKKETIKTGVMQELLRPKEGWELKLLRDIAELKNGYSFKSSNYDNQGDYVIVTIGCVQDGQMVIEGASRISNLPSDLQFHQRLECGDILISMTGNVGRVCRVEYNGCLLNQRVGKLIPKEIHEDFLFYSLRTRAFLKSMEDSAQGGAQGNIGKNEILNFEISVPPSMKTQREIAMALDSFENEISALGLCLLKYRNLKAAIMDELLTGKTRLV